MACSESERAAFLAKHASYQRIKDCLRPNRNVGRFSPPPVHLPRRGKMKAKAAA